MLTTSVTPARCPATTCIAAAFSAARFSQQPPQYAGTTLLPLTATTLCAGLLASGLLQSAIACGKSVSARSCSMRLLACVSTDAFCCPRCVACVPRRLAALAARSFIGRSSSRHSRMLGLISPLFWLVGCSIWKRRSSLAASRGTPSWWNGGKRHPHPAVICVGALRILAGLGPKQLGCDVLFPPTWPHPIPQTLSREKPVQRAKQPPLPSFPALPPNPMVSVTRW